MRSSQVKDGVPALLLSALLLLASPVPASADTSTTAPPPHGTGLQRNSFPAYEFAAPRLTPEQVGAVIENVHVETFGVVDSAFIRRYLTLRQGDRVSQFAIDHDYNNLLRLGQYRTRLQVENGSAPHTVRLLWIVQSKYLKPTTHPFYADAPLSAPIQGAGWVITSPPVDNGGGNFSTYSQFSRRANLIRALFTQPLSINADKGTQNSIVTDWFGGRGVYRASQPEAINVYSWNAGEEALWLSQATNGTQVEAGLRVLHSTDELPSAVVATSVFSTYRAPAHISQLSAGVSHGCLTGPNRWYPPYCSLQYRFQVTDAIGGLGANTIYRTVNGDLVRYFSLGESTFLLHGTISRSGGVLPDSFLSCAIAWSYPKPFCGTDEQGLNAEFRLNDHKNNPLQFAFFADEAASRVRGSEVPFATTYFSWYPDMGIGITFRMVRINIAYGKDGGRISGELKGSQY